ncbi:ABC transporter permease [Microbacterium tumbae]
MNATRIGVIARLELTQRVRSVAWYVLLGVFVLVMLGVTAFAYMAYSWIDSTGAGVYSIVVNFVLLLVVLVSPTLSGNAINGDRDSATLAPVQITMATTGDILIGKLIAAVATGLAFVVVSIPFLLLATLAGGVPPETMAVSLLVLVAEIVVIAAIGVGLSGLLARPLFSVASTYLVVAALVIGTLIVFGLAGSAIRSEQTVHTRTIIWTDESGEEGACGEWETYTSEIPRFDLVWGVLAANPFVVLADATPVRFDAEGYPIDLFGQLKFGLRSAQQAPDLETRWDDCAPYQGESYPTPEEVIANSVPSWFVGLAVQVVIAGGLLAGAWSRTRTPAKRLPPGTRIA